MTSTEEKKTRPVGVRTQALARVRVLDPDQLQEFLEKFKHRERFEAYPDLFLSRKDTAVFSYDSREGSYKISDTKTFMGYQRVISLSQRRSQEQGGAVWSGERQMCFSTDKIDIIENGILKSSSPLPGEIADFLIRSQVLYLPGAKVVILSIKTSQTASRIFVFSRRGSVLSSITVNAPVRRIKECSFDLKGVLVEFGSGATIYTIEDNNLVPNLSFPMAFSALCFGNDRFIIVRQGVIELFAEKEIKTSIQFHHHLDSIKLTESRFAVETPSMIRIFDIVGDSILPRDILPNRVHPAVRITDEMFLANNSIWKLEGKRYRQIQTYLPGGYVSVGFVPSSQRERLKGFLVREVRSLVGDTAGIVVGFIG